MQKPYAVYTLCLKIIKETMWGGTDSVHKTEH